MEKVEEILRVQLGGTDRRRSKICAWNGR